MFLRDHPKVVPSPRSSATSPLKGPAAENLTSMGIGKGAGAVARMYADFVDVFVVDSSTRISVLRSDIGNRCLLSGHDHEESRASEELAHGLLVL